MQQNFQRLLKVFQKKKEKLYILFLKSNMLQESLSLASWTSLKNIEIFFKKSISNFDAKHKLCNIGDLQKPI